APDRVRAIESVARRAAALGLAPGYPFVVTFDDMPARDPRRRGLVVVAGLFADEALAEKYRAALPLESELVELASVEEASKRAVAQDGVADDVFTRNRYTAFELREAASAYRTRDLEVIESKLGEELSRHWVGVP